MSGTIVQPRVRRARQPPALQPQPLYLAALPPTLASERLLVRIGDAGAILACEKKFVYKLLAAGEIETIGHGASRRVVVESLRAYVERELERERGRRPQA